MRKTLAVIAVIAAPCLAAASLVTTMPARPSVYLFGRWIVLTNATNLGGAIPERSVRITSIDGYVYGPSGGGAGATVITITDGTNTCTGTLARSVSAGYDSVAFTMADGTGTGCTFAAGAHLVASVTTAGCTTTQPTINLNVRGTWQ